MSFGRSFTVGFLGMLGGLLVNILTNPASEFAARFRLPLVPLLVATLLFVILVSAILQILPSRRGSAPPQLQAQLVEHRAALGRLKERCLSEQLWTASCIEAWQEHQRSILALKRAFSDLGIPAKDDPIDIEPPPRLGCGLRLALVVKNTAALLVVPLVAFAASYFAAFRLDYHRLNPVLAAIRLPESGGPAVMEKVVIETRAIPTLTPALYRAARVQPSPAMTPTPPPTRTSVPATQMPIAIPTQTANTIHTLTPTHAQTTLVPTRMSRPRTSTPPPASGATPKCLSSGSCITWPADGDSLKGVIEVRGTANTTDLQKYKIEVQLEGSADWMILRESHLPVVDGVLLEWHTNTMTPGGYSVRLTVIDRSGNYLPPAVIHVYVTR